MGIVLVACLAARIVGGEVAARISTFKLQRVHGYEAWDAVPVSFNITMLDQDVFPFNIAKVPAALDRQATRPGSGLLAAHGNQSEDFLRLLGLGGKAKRKRPRRQAQEQRYFFFSVWITTPVDTYHSPLLLDYLTVRPGSRPHQNVELAEGRQGDSLRGLQI